MQKQVLNAKNEQGVNAAQPLPTIEYQILWDKDTHQLGVIFDVKHSPIAHFYANFHTFNGLTLTRIMQADFLWENNCYELFLGFGTLDKNSQQNSPYIEINFSPEGYFNLYQFDGYRVPKQMPPHRLSLTESERQTLLNFYNVKGDTQAVFWQTSNMHQQALKTQIEKNFALAPHTHRLVMMIDLSLLAKILGEKIQDTIWLNPCAVFVGEQGRVYFAHQHASPPDFHDKSCWIKLTS